MLRRVRRALTWGGLAAAFAGGLWGASRAAIRRYERIHPDQVQKPGTMFYVTGVGIHYTEAGSGPPLILIHGFAASSFKFRKLLVPLSKHFRVIAPDLKGFGLSDRPLWGDYSLPAQARLIRELMNHLKIERATILGHSMGGDVALYLAAKYPEKVEKLILVGNPAGEDPFSLAGLWPLLRPLAPLGLSLALRNRRFVERMLRNGYYDPSHLTPEVIEDYLMTTRIEGTTDAWLKVLSDQRQVEPPDPSKVTQPCLLIWGAEDRAVPLRYGEREAGLILGAKLVSIPQAGHDVVVEKSEECAQAILAFVQEKQEKSSPPRRRRRTKKSEDGS